MGTGVPLLNEYKLDFFWKRVPQSTLGGPKLKLGYDAPVYVYVNQLLLFLIPWLLGGVFTVLVELELVENDTGIYIYGGLMCVYVILVNFISEMIKNKEAPDISANTKAKNMLSEEEEIDFQTCCGTETVAFVVPGKKYKLNIVIHALISGPLCGLGFWYLLPKTLNDIYGNIAATIILHAFGWLTITIAQYSLTVGSPPETANFKTLDTWEVTPLMRPFYCLVFFSFDVLAREFGEFKLVNEILHGAFVFLPILWLLGVLPPLTALVLWLGEQGLTILFGGSPMASDFRLLVMVVLSVCTYLAVNFIPHGLVTVALMSVFGYLLSLDLGGLGAQILSMCCLGHPRLSRDFVKDRDKGFLWSWGVREFLYHTLMLLVIVTIAVVMNKYVASDDDQQLAEDLADYFAYAIIALLVIEVLLSEIQTVYILFGLWRNKLYPSSVQRTTIFTKGKSRLGILGYVRRIIMDWVSPFLMLVFLSLSVSFDKVSTDYGADKILGLHRAYRWIWQSTQNSMLEISIVKIISLTTDASKWKNLGLGMQLLIVGLGRDRIIQILNKLYFYVMLLIWSWKDKKQRRKNSYLMITFNIIFFPLFLTVILFSAVVSAPLLPLFTLPLFLVGFPRPHRFWPAEVGASANVCDDTVYYGHMAPQLVKVFRNGFALGSLGEPSPGCHYLVRFQDRMAWIMVLERGYAYCAVSIKGLELQETSCHTIEAGRIEDIFEVTFEKENGVPCCSWHPHPLDTLRPYDAATIKTYSDAKNVLTGVIDSPEALQKVADGFVPCLIWVMLHHNYKRNKGSFGGNDRDDVKDKPKTGRSSKCMSNERPSSVKAWKRLSTNGSTPTMEESKTDIGGAFDEWESEIVFGEALNNSDIKKKGIIGPPRPGTAESAEFKRRPLSAKSFSDSVWSDDSMMFESLDTKNTQKVNLVSGMVAHQKKNRSPKGSLTPVEDNFEDMPGVLGGDEPNKKRKNSEKKPNKSQQNYDDSIDNLSLFGDGDFGLPASDINQKPPTRLPQLFGKPTAKEPVGSFAEITALNALAQFSCHYSKVVSPPHIWTQIPMDPSTLEKYCENFPIDWYRHVLRCLHLVVEGDKPTDVTDQVADDKVLQSMYSKLVIACNAVVNILGLGGVDVVQMGTSHVYKMYIGDIPWSVASTWITDDKELLDVVVKAYRYSVKLAIDQILLGDASSNEELQEYMEEYDRDWYIGSEKDPQWRESVVHGKPTLFSLGHNPVDVFNGVSFYFKKETNALNMDIPHEFQNTYNSRTLSIQDIPVYIGSLNAEVVRGQWANLGLELLYMTNDDEERYSIQAHPTILRNLTVQAADPPLGYPIYASPPVSIPTL